MRKLHPSRSAFGLWLTASCVLVLVSAFVAWPVCAWGEEPAGEGFGFADVPSEFGDCPPGHDIHVEAGIGVRRLVCELDGVWDGPSAYVDETGRILAYGHHLSDKKQGTWWYFDKVGRPRLLTHFEEGVPDGEEVRFFETGAVQESREYANGKLNGKSQLFCETGERIRIGTWKDGELVSGWKYFTRAGDEIRQPESALPPGTTWEPYPDGTTRRYFQTLEGTLFGVSLVRDIQGHPAKLSLISRTGERADIVAPAEGNRSVGEELALAAKWQPLCHPEVMELPRSTLDLPFVGNEAVLEEIFEPWKQGSSGPPRDQR